MTPHRTSLLGSVWRKLLVLVTIGILCLPRSVVADEPMDAELRQRLERTEARLDSLARAHAALRTELGVDGRAGMVVVKPAGREPTLAFGGLVQVQAEAGDRGDLRFGNANDRIFMRRARLNGTGRFLEEFDFRVELDLAGGLSPASGLRAQLTDGFVNWNRYKHLQVRTGQFKTPFGFEQLYGDPRLFTIERTLANDVLTLSRQLGVQVHGDVLGSRLAYAMGIFNGNGTNTSANDDEDFLRVARLSAIPWRGKIGRHAARWSVGGGGYGSQDASVLQRPELAFDAVGSGAVDNVFQGDRWGASGDMQLSVGPLELWVEALGGRFEPTNDLPATRVEAIGGNAQASVFVVPKRLQLLAKLDVFDPDRDRGGNSTRTWTFGVLHAFKSDDLRFQFNYLRVDAQALRDVHDRFLARIQTIF